MPTIVVFDCESDGLPFRRGKDSCFDRCQCTCACAIIVPLEASSPSSSSSAPQPILRPCFRKAEKRTYWRDELDGFQAPFEGLFQAFDDAMLIVGYNSLGFDLPLLRKHYTDTKRYFAHRCKSLDVFTRVRDVLEYWPKLDHLLKENNLGLKTGTGAEAVKMWEDGRRKELAAYCMVDVRKTAELASLSHLIVNGKSIPNYVFGIEPTISAMQLFHAYQGEGEDKGEDKGEGEGKGEGKGEGGGDTSFLS